MRIDIAETIAAVEPSIWRFPGGEPLSFFLSPSLRAYWFFSLSNAGNNLEGQTTDTRWKWNE